MRVDDGFFPWVVFVLLHCTGERRLCFLIEGMLFSIPME